MKPRKRDFLITSIIVGMTITQLSYSEAITAPEIGTPDATSSPSETRLTEDWKPLSLDEAQTAIKNFSITQNGGKIQARGTVFKECEQFLNLASNEAHFNGSNTPPYFGVAIWANVDEYNACNSSNTGKACGSFGENCAYLTENSRFSVSQPDADVEVVYVTQDLSLALSDPQRYQTTPLGIKLVSSSTRAKESAEKKAARRTTKVEDLVYQTENCRDELFDLAEDAAWELLALGVWSDEDYDDWEQRVVDEENEALLARAHTIPRSEFKSYMEELQALADRDPSLGNAVVNAHSVLAHRISSNAQEASLAELETILGIFEKAKKTRGISKENKAVLSNDIRGIKLVALDKSTKMGASGAHYFMSRFYSWAPDLMNSTQVGCSGNLDSLEAIDQCATAQQTAQYIQHLPMTFKQNVLREQQQKAEMQRMLGSLGGGLAGGMGQQSPTMSGLNLANFGFWSK